MKILLVSPFLPYPGAGHSGGKYGYYLLRTLCERHEVHLVTRLQPGEEKQLPHLQAIVAGLEIVSAPGAYSTPSLVMLVRVVASYWFLARSAKRVLMRERFDIAQVEWTHSGLFWSIPAATPAVVSFLDVMVKPAQRQHLAARGFNRIITWVKLRLTRVVEGFVASKFQRIFTVSEDDRKWANKLYPKANVQVLAYPCGLEFVGLPKKESPNRILFVGAMNRLLNVEAVQWFVRGCLPAILRELPDTELHIVGQGLADEHRIRWSSEPAIKIIGAVESVEKHYKEAAVFVAPILTGGGIIVKILDGLAAGVPVVSTSHGNEGIGAENGKAILVADTPEGFASAVVRLLQSKELRQAIGEAGRQYVEHAFSPMAFAARLEQTYAELVHSGASNR